jgi:hypothetical protein
MYRFGLRFKHDFIENGQAFKKTDVARYTAMSMGFTPKEFPQKMPIYWIMDDAA